MPAEARWLLSLFCLGLGCEPKATPHVEPQTFAASAWADTELAIRGLPPERYLRVEGSGLRLEDDFGSHIGGVSTRVLVADGAGVRVALEAPLEVGAHDLRLRAGGETWTVPRAVYVVADDAAVPRDAAAFDAATFDAATFDAAVTDGGDGATPLPDDAATDVGTVALCAAPCGVSCSRACPAGTTCICEDGCGCALECAEGEACSTRCRDPETRCSVRGEGADAVTATCEDFARCELELEGALRVRVVCHNQAACDVDCHGVADCRVECRSGARCRVRCDEGDECRLTRCEAVDRTCDDGFACGRDC